MKELKIDARRKLVMENHINCSACPNKLCFVQLHCSQAWINIINEAKNQFWYEKGDYIFREGDRIFGLYFIERGKVKIISTGLHNKEQVVRLAAAGHILGHKGQGNETYPVGAVAIETTQVCFVDNDIIYETFMNNPKFTFAVMMFYSFELRKTEIRGRRLAQMSIREKMADTLLYLCEIFGMNAEDNSINVILSRKEIADIAGVGVEQAIHQLSEFEDESLITKSGRKLQLRNTDKLLKIVEAHNISRYTAGQNKFNPHDFPLN